MASSSSSSNGAGAINLLEKYTTLNRSMDDARRENTRIQSEKESIRQEIEKLRKERVDMQAQTVEARDDTTTLNKNVQDALSKYTELEDRHAQALLEKTEACRQLQFAKNYVEEQRQEFLQESRDFRTTCKRMRLSASAVGEDMVTSMAFLERHDVDVDWTSDGDEVMDDVDLEQALVKHARRKQERDDAERALEAVRTRDRTSSQKSANRLEQKSKLRAQLERVRKDNTDYENQLKDLDEQTKEAREMAHNYEKDMNRRMSNNSGARGRPQQSYGALPSVTPTTMPRSQQAGPPQNPYAATRNARRRTSSTVRPPHRQQQQQQQQSSGVGRNWDSNEAQPHLMTRRRPFQREFGSTALDIISGREMEEDDLFDPRPPLEPEPVVYQTMGGNPVTSSINLDSDSDDDEDLFSGSVFLKK